MRYQYEVIQAVLMKSGLSQKNKKKRIEDVYNIHEFHIFFKFLH